MKITEAYELIFKEPHTFTTEEIEFDPSELVDGITLAMHWIAKHKSLPQKELLHSPEIKDMHGYTCAMHWIDCVHTFPPKELLHDPSITDKFKRTCAMHWIDCVKTPPPQEFYHDPTMKDWCGRTCAMYWIKYVKTLPPKEWMHDPALGRHTCAMYWIHHVKNEPIPPELLQIKVKHVLCIGFNIDIHFLRRKYFMTHRYKINKVKHVLHTGLCV